MADFDLIQTGQEVQDILTGAAMQTDLTAENERAEQAEQTLQDNIDAEETRAKAAEKQNADDIDVIESKIPAGASDQNQLADKEFVNSSIATATATYRGAYNEVSDLSLTVDATHEQIAAALAGAISTADNNDYCFVQIPTADATPTQIAAIERYKFNGTAWAYEYTLNNSGFTAAQWAALNSGITSGLVAKLSALPTNEALTLALAGKQDVLTFDSVPVDGSNNPVKSGGVYSAIGDEETRAKAAEKANADDIDNIEALIPAAASDENQLADKEYVNSSISTATATYRGSFNEVNDLSLTTDATHEQIATALAGAISTADNNDYCFVQIPTSDDAPTQIASIERYKFNGTAWAYEYTLNNSGFTAAQWAALNSGITSGLVAKLSALPTNDALTLALAGKQDVLTFDNEPTSGSNNPVKSGGVYDAIDVEATTRAAAIAAIVALIPEAASALNQLADKSFVNSSISTATAVFKGTYNVVVDLELSYNATQEQIATMLASKIISADNNDYCFVQIPTSDAAPLQIARTDRYKFNGTAWAYEYTLNNSGFTAAQWAAINSGITSLLKDKLIDLPTATELTALLAAKQNQLTFDTTPTTGSTNPVTSGGIKSAIDTEKARAEAAEADRYTKSETYNKTEINGMVSTPHQNYVTVPTYASLPSSGQSTDTIYRVSSYDGANNQVDDTVYSEYAWDGTQYVFLRVNSQIEEVFDITVYNSNTKYADLSAALGVDGANIPATLRRGGMSVKFVQSSDNKYVQFRCIADEFTTNVTQWQGVDDKPVDGSKNLVQSGGVFHSILEKESLCYVKYVGRTLVYADGSLGFATENYSVTDYIDVTEIPFIYYSLRSADTTCCLIAAFDESKQYIQSNSVQITESYTVQKGVWERGIATKYIMIAFIKSNDEYKQAYKVSPLVRQLMDAKNTFNVNAFNATNGAYNDKASARGSIPVLFRKTGLIITYKLSDGWYTEKHIANNISDWSSDCNWEPDVDDKTTITLTKYDGFPLSYYVDGSVWAYRSDGIASYIYPLKKGDVIRIKANSISYAEWYLLSNVDGISVGSEVHFVSGSERMRTSANTESYIYVGEDCYLNVYSASNSAPEYQRFPSELVRYTEMPKSASMIVDDNIGTNQENINEAIKARCITYKNEDAIDANSVEWGRYEMSGVSGVLVPTISRLVSIITVPDNYKNPRITITVDSGYKCAISQLLSHVSDGDFSSVLRADYNPNTSMTEWENNTDVTLDTATKTVLVWMQNSTAGTAIYPSEHSHISVFSYHFDSLPVIHPVAPAEIADGNRSVLKSNNPFTKVHGFSNNNNLKLFNPYNQCPKNQYRGQMHCHTTNSDGEYSALVVTQKYKDGGYDFITITDHNYITHEPQGNPLTWLCNSYEDTAWNQHMCIYNVDGEGIDGVYKYVNMYDTSSTVAEKVEHYATHGISLVELAHPDSDPYHVSDAVIQNYPNGVSYVEIWNSSNQSFVANVASRSELPSNPRNQSIYYLEDEAKYVIYRRVGSSYQFDDLVISVASRSSLPAVSDAVRFTPYYLEDEQIYMRVNDNATDWEQTVLSYYTEQNTDRCFAKLLDKGYKTFCLAVDDFHRDGQFTYGWINVFSFDSTKEGIWNAICNGCYYASTGVKLKEVMCTNGVFHIEIDTEAHPDTVATFKFKSEGNTVLQTSTGTSADYKINGDENFIRCVVEIDTNDVKYGVVKAYTNPVWVLDSKKQYEF